jgi:ABC-type antimicrobial peptide transport system permease subunit
VATIWLMRSVAGVVPDVPASDPLALALVTIVVATTGLAAACLPAYRATRVSAMEALRHE